MARSEIAMQLAVMQTYKRSTRCICPNYTPRNWWECDVWLVNKRGFVWEFEIKRTMADFRNDGNKVRKTIFTNNTSKKHEKIRCDDGPSRFYFVVPESIVEEVSKELPEWAGLLVYKGLNRKLKCLRQAPQLHAKKVDENEVDLARNRMWYRYWALLRRYERVTRKKGE